MTYASKKTKSITPACLFASCLFMTQAVAHASTIIYGIDNAHHVSASAQGPFYIQLAAFRSAEQANRYLHRLKLDPSYPAAIVRHGDFHAVKVGPIASAKEVGMVRLTGSRVLTVVNKTPSPQVKTIASTTKPQLLDGPWTIGADMGITFPNRNHTMTVSNGSGYPPPLNVDEYTTHHHQPAILGVQLGRRWERAERWVPAYSASLRYQHLFTQNLHGSITQYSLPQFKNYSYRWGMNAEVLSFNGKVDVVKFGRVMPYVDAGLGVSLNRGRSYHETAYAGVTPRISPGFVSHGQGQLYYNAGGGLDVQITPQVIMYGGYDYQSFGHMTSGRGQSTWAGEKLSLGNFASNTVLVGLTYIVGDSLL